MRITVIGIDVDVESGVVEKCTVATANMRLVWSEFRGLVSLHSCDDSGYLKSKSERYIRD